MLCPVKIETRPITAKKAIVIRPIGARIGMLTVDAMVPLAEAGQDFIADCARTGANLIRTNVISDQLDKRSRANLTRWQAGYIWFQP